ncbi:MAG: SRPBCC domain-containing protein [Sediminibacterium sp.]
MTEPRKDTASIFIKAAAEKAYQALTAQSSIREWKAPVGMHMEIFHYNPRVGGTYRIALRYKDQKIKGKSSDNLDMVNGKFLELVPVKKIVEAVRFESTDPLFAGEMIMTTELATEKGGTRVTLIAEQIPPGITPEDHAAGMDSSLENLKVFLESV